MPSAPKGPGETSNMVKKVILLTGAASAAAFVPAAPAAQQARLSRGRATSGVAALKAEEGFRSTLKSILGMGGPKVKCGINGFGRIGRQVSSWCARTGMKRNREGVAGILEHSW